MPVTPCKEIRHSSFGIVRPSTHLLCPPASLTIVVMCYKLAFRRRYVASHGCALSVDAHDSIPLSEIFLDPGYPTVTVYCVHDISRAYCEHPSHVKPRHWRTSGSEVWPPTDHRYVSVPGAQRSSVVCAQLRPTNFPKQARTRSIEKFTLALSMGKFWLALDVADATQSCRSGRLESRRTLSNILLPTHSQIYSRIASRPLMTVVAEPDGRSEQHPA